MQAILRCGLISSPSFAVPARWSRRFATRDLVGYTPNATPLTVAWRKFAWPYRSMTLVAINTVSGSEEDKALRATTRTWALPYLYGARAYLLAQFRAAQRGVERDELERMTTAIGMAINGWKDDG